MLLFLYLIAIWLPCCFCTLLLYDCHVVVFVPYCYMIALCIAIGWFFSVAGTEYCHTYFWIAKDLAWMQGWRLIHSWLKPHYQTFLIIIIFLGNVLCSLASQPWFGPSLYYTMDCVQKTFMRFGISWHCFFGCLPISGDKYFELNIILHSSQ